MIVAKIMSRDVTTVTPATSLKDVASLLVAKGISGAPVVDEDGTVLGVISETDILVKERMRESRGALLIDVLLEVGSDTSKHDARVAGDAMTRPAITIRPGRPVAEAAGLMLDRAVNRLPVVDDHGRLLGIVTRADLVRAFARSDEEIAHEIRDDVILRTLWNTPDRFQIDVVAGEVTIEGEVSDAKSAELLTRFVERVPGVVAVRSHITWP
ncbi:MAG: CBS domain-containing protein [Gaiellaceae bacterium]